MRQTETLSARIDAVAWRHGVGSGDSALLAAALNLARVFGYSIKEEGSTRQLLARIAESLRPQSDSDGITAAKDWLRNPSISDDILDQLDDEVETLLGEAPDTPNWDDELGAALDSGGFRGSASSTQVPVPMAKALLEVLRVPQSGELACAFGAAASIAWCLAETRPVRLYAGDPDVARLFAMFVAASGRTLFIDRRNPLDGSYMTVVSEVAIRDRPPLAEVDYLISVPPFGARLRDFDGASISVEALQIERLWQLARKEFLTIIPDGFLFRDSRNDARNRRELVMGARVEVESLPAGIFGRSTGIATSLVRVGPGSSSTVRFVDGRNMPSQSSGKIQERLIVQHLSNWAEILGNEDRLVEAPVEVVAENNFMLTPDRYVRPRSLQLVEDASAELPRVLLTDVAKIERAKAPRPMHDVEGEAALVCRELAPADLEGGVVRKPERLVSFSSEEAPRARNVAVKAGDILISIKGNVGAVGIVPPSAPDPESNEPWIISQSLAIIRYHSNPHVPSAELLNAILTAPWVRESLERLAGGSTVRTLSMADLRQLQIPLLLPEQFQVVNQVLDMVAKTRDEVSKLQDSIGAYQRRIWMKLWGMNPDEQDESQYA